MAKNKSRRIRKNHPSRSEVYWASLPIADCCQELMNRIEDYYEFLQACGKLTLYRRSYEYYYRPAMLGSRVNAGGAVGELTTISVNHYRNLLKHLHTMTTSQRPAFECRATNTDHKSQAQTILGQGLLDYYLREKRLERYLKQCVEYALVLAEGFLSVTWDVTAGEKYGVNPQTGAVQHEGDVKYLSLTPLDYIRDFRGQTPFENQWGVVRTWKNKYELAAKYPDLADEILMVKNDSFENVTFEETRLYDFDFTFGEDDNDMIATYEFYHGPTDALPNGRLVSFINSDLWLFDGPLPYREVPVYRISASEWMDTPFGYTCGFDQLPIQEMNDAVHSTVCTNQVAFGVQNVWAKKGDTPEVTTLSGGLQLVQSDTPPEPLQMTKTAPETFDYMAILDQLQETFSGVNSVSRGNPEASLKSGAALALVQSMAIQFSMDLQQSYAQLLEDAGTATLKILRDFATVPRVAAITGKSNRQYMKEFSGDDLSQINRVTVDMGNPLMRTTAGKVNMADQLLTNGLITTPEQYIMVLTTGKLEPLYEAQQSELMLIRSENEDLSEGKQVRALITDQHHIHVKEHAVVTASPEARKTPQIAVGTTAHMQEHIQLWRGMDPALAQLLGIPPPPPPMMMPGMLPAPGSAPNPQAQPPNAQGMTPPAQMLDAENPVTKEAAKVKNPNMPKPPKGTDPRTAAVIEGMAMG